MNNLYNLIIKRRSIRKYKQDPIPLSILKKIVNAGRLAPSAANLQPLEYIIVSDKNLCEKIFPHIRWANYIAPEGDPKEGEKPTSYIIVCVNKKIKEEGFEKDVGASVENMILAALSFGIGSCFIDAFSKSAIKEIFDLPYYIEPTTILSLGYPSESPVIEEAKDSIKYWKDENQILHVPKRPLYKIMHINKYEKKEEDQIYKVFIDGASKGNPGLAGIGVLICDFDGNKIKDLSKFIGEATSNVAEYKALILALKELKKLNINAAIIFSDSFLLVNQINEKFKVNDVKLKKLYKKAKSLIESFNFIKINYIRRSENKIADSLANKAIKEVKDEK